MPQPPPTPHQPYRPNRGYPRPCRRRLQTVARGRRATYGRRYGSGKSPAGARRSARSARYGSGSCLAGARRGALTARYAERRRVAGRATGRGVREEGPAARGAVLLPAGRAHQRTPAGRAHQRAPAGHISTRKAPRGVWLRERRRRRRGTRAGVDRRALARAGRCGRWQARASVGWEALAWAGGCARALGAVGERVAGVARLGRGAGRAWRVGRVVRAGAGGAAWCCQVGGCWRCCLVLTDQSKQPAR